MKNLISMTDFVLEQRKIYEGDFEDLADLYYRYAKFLKQPLELWMFVPCDEDGNVLEIPQPTEGDDGNWNYQARFSKYQQAKERCLFDGFEFTESQKYSTINGIKNSVHWYTKNRLYLTTKKEDGYHSYFQLFTIEDLIQCDVQLNQTAQKQIGL